MPFDSKGFFTRVHNWERDRQNDIDIVSDRHDEEDDNFANGFNDCLLRDGRSAMTGNLKMGNFQIKGVAKGTVDTDAVNKSQMDALATAVMKAINSTQKIGDIKASVRDANHDNWFLCDGQAISRIEYSGLFDIIGTKFGEGDGTTTFNLPDYRGKFLRGLGGDSASDIYTTQAEGLPNATSDGVGSITGHNSGTNEKGALTLKSTGGDNVSGAGSTWYNNTLSLDLSKSNPIYGASEHVTPINQAVNYFIKVKEEV